MGSPGEGPAGLVVSEPQLALGWWPGPALAGSLFVCNTESVRASPLILVRIGQPLSGTEPPDPRSALVGLEYSQCFSPPGLEMHFRTWGATLLLAPTAPQQPCLALSGGRPHQGQILWLSLLHLTKPVPPLQVFTLPHTEFLPPAPRWLVRMCLVHPDTDEVKDPLEMGEGRTIEAAVRSSQSSRHEI